MLTKRQKEVIDYIKAYTNQKGYAPSLEEMRKRFRLASVSTAHFHVKRLRDAGYLTRGENKPRSISLVEIALPQRELPQAGNIYARRAVDEEEGLTKKDMENFVNQVIEGDCLEIMKHIPANSIDMILCDLPYGTTQNQWDSIIPLNKLWEQYERIIKDNGVIALTAQGLFSAKLMLSNPKLFKYKIVWIKSKPTNFLNAKKQPLRKHEDVLIFYKSQPHYNPQMSKSEPYNKGFRKDQLTGSYGDFKTVEVKSNGERYPTDVVYFKTAESEGPVYHPTQKPVELGRYLIRTFTQPNDIVLDNTCGSGSFLVAAVLEGRRFIGIEKNQEVYLFKKKRVDYIEVCKQRIKEAEKQHEAESSKLKLF